MALLVTQQAVVGTALAPTYVAAAASDTINPDDRLILHVKNAGGSTDTVTLVVPGTTYGQANPDAAHTVGAGTDRFISVPASLVDPTTGLITVTHSFTTSVTVALIRS